MPAEAPEIAFAWALASRLGRLARRNGADDAAVTVVEQITAMLGRSVALGHVCAPFGALCARLQLAPAVVRRALAAGAMLGSDAPLVLDPAGRLYLARHDDAERRLALGLLDLLRAPPHRRLPPSAAPSSTDASADTDGSANLPSDDALVTPPVTPLAARLARGFGRSEPTDASGDVDWQQVAAALALHSRLAVISGGPGTGKTTTVAAIIACLLDAEPELNIALAAPTGKAAQRMLEALAGRARAMPAELAARFPTVSFTLHRLLGTRGDGSFRHRRGAPLPYDVVVVDEASMIDLSMAARLVDALAPGARLILLGDKDQLSAVEAGAVFAELCAQPTLSAPLRARFGTALGVSPERLRQGGSAPTVVQPALPDTAVWLERNYRFGADSPIGRVAVAVRDGNADAARNALSAASVADLRDDDQQAGALWIELAGDGPLDPPTIAALVEGYAAFFRALNDWRRLHETAEAGPQRDQLAAVGDDAARFGAATHTAGASGGISGQGLSNAFGNGSSNGSSNGASGEPQADPNAPAAREAALLALFDTLARYRVLCAVREGPRGTHALNAAVSARVRGLAERLGMPTMGGEWFAGRAVMIARNDYPLRLFNGDIGITLADGQGVLRVYFQDAASATGFRSLSPAALPPLDSAFAMTVHKSQGSEFDAVALVLPSPGVRGTSRELVYTGITRAKRRVALIGARSVLEAAVTTPTRRDSGLLDRIRRYRPTDHRGGDGLAGSKTADDGDGDGGDSGGEPAPAA
ncbi:AAA family ATPase [Chitinasiproducens palmae]|nr:AAA family ATPase [Chitinasiproducens palmae]